MKNNPSFFLAFSALAAASCALPANAQNLEEIYKTGQKVCQYFYRNDNGKFYFQKGWDYCITSQGEVFGSASVDSNKKYGRQGALAGYLDREVTWTSQTLREGKYWWKIYFKQSNNGSTLEKYSCGTTSKGVCLSAPSKTNYQYVFDINELNREVRRKEQEDAARDRKFWQEQRERERRTKEYRENNDGKNWWQTYPKAPR